MSAVNKVFTIATAHVKVNAIIVQTLNIWQQKGQSTLQYKYYIIVYMIHNTEKN